MSSASPWSATCLRMKLRKPAYSRTPEIRWSSCAIGHCLLSASSIYICRRLGQGKYCKENALVANLGLPRTQSAGKSSSMPCVRRKERNVGVASPERRPPFGRTLLRGTKERNTALQLGG